MRDRSEKENQNFSLKRGISQIARGYFQSPGTRGGAKWRGDDLIARGQVGMKWKCKLGKIACPLSNTFVAKVKIFSLAARLGLEPRQNESESFVLPITPSGSLAKPFQPRRKMEPAMGFEPATACLQNRCSAIELRRQNSLRALYIIIEKKIWEITEGIWQNLSTGPRERAGGSPGTRTPNLLIKSQLLYH